MHSLPVNTGRAVNLLKTGKGKRCTHYFDVPYSLGILRYVSDEEKRTGTVHNNVIHVIKGSVALPVA